MLKKEIKNMICLYNEHIYENLAAVSEIKS